MGPDKDLDMDLEKGGAGNIQADQAESVTAISQLGYEECRDELIEVVRLLEQGGLDLDASLAMWERGEKLAKRCEEHLAGARKRVEDALSAGENQKT
jgi:exodeoxyribonuclease VII small subunit